MATHTPEENHLSQASQQPLPAFYYPSKTVWIDDDSLFLEALMNRYEDTYQMEVFTESNKAINMLNDYRPPICEKSFLQAHSEHENYDLANHIPVDINLNELANTRLNEARLNEISILVIDYQMPGVNGLEICRQLKDSPIKKILLTGQTNTTEAIEAFNARIIDCFIRKDTDDLAIALEQHIASLTQSYFTEKSRPIHSYLQTEQCSPLTDPSFIHFFTDLCQKKQIKEYYLTDKNGSFILIDENERSHHLVVHTDRSLSAFIHTNDDDERIQTYLELVEQKKKIPFFGLNKEGWQVAIDNWNDHFFTPEVIQGREKYYYTVVEQA